jgi:hypothetical protein
MTILSILTGVPAALADIYKRRMEIKHEDRQLERAEKKALAERRIELIKEGLHADMQWEMEMARQAATSWKDEYTLLVISIPAILCFIPGGAVYVASGFAALEKTPVWYQLMFCCLFAATVGIRWWRKNQSDT